MSQEIRDFVSPVCELLGIGEPVHREPALGWVRNEFFARLVDSGFRSIALETDRVAALIVDDYVREGISSFAEVMLGGFSHGFGELVVNRRLVEWMREFNRGRAPHERLAFYGFDGQTENTTAHSPRRYLEYARDYLGVDVDIAGVAGDDERWEREEAILEAASSPGATADAERLRVIGIELLGQLAGRVSATDGWRRARTYLMAGLGLLRYHAQAALPDARDTLIVRLLATRDGLMARNLLDIREIEAGRGPTLVGAHNVHLQKNPSTLHMPGGDVNWLPVGAVVTALFGDRYAFVAGGLGRSGGLGLGEPGPDTYEWLLQGRVGDWGLVPADLPNSAPLRADVPHGLVPLEWATLDGADAVMHIGDADAVRAKLASPSTVE
jgi:erythromycin esterase-like protein